MLSYRLSYGTKSHSWPPNRAFAVQLGFFQLASIYFNKLNLEKFIKLDTHALFFYRATLYV